MEIGEQIGPYRILRVLGEGGVGVVYEVEHVQTGAHVALKAFSGKNHDHVRLLREKFLVEGKTLALLYHPRLVRASEPEVDEATGTPYFVMDLVLAADGNPKTLADVRVDSVAEADILRWFGELAEVLDYVHAQGIVHRDIKPGNVLLDAEGHAVLSDFGVSRVFGDRIRSDVEAVTTFVTEAATGDKFVLGTRGYMAPEVRGGGQATPAADVYSLGVAFVLLLTGMWYESGSQVTRMLTTFTYRWHEVLPSLLAEAPADRPKRLLPLLPRLNPPPDLDEQRIGERPTVVRKVAGTRRNGGRAFWLIGMLAAILLAVMAVWRPWTSLEDKLDDFREIFGVEQPLEEET